MRSSLLLAVPVLVVVAALSACTPKATATADPPPPAPAPAPKPVAAVAATTTLGEPITAQAVSLSAIAQSPAAYENKVVATSGTVTAVCQHRGCWMELADDSGQPQAQQAHVVLGGHKFFVPKDASGRHARVQATVLKTDEDSECTQEAAQQTGKPVAKLQLEATGVELD